MSTFTALRWYPVKTAHASLTDAISAGRYDYVNSDINAHNFKSSGAIVVATELTLYQPECCSANGIDNDTAIQRLCEAHLRPANLQDLLAFGETHPEVFPTYGIVALGSVGTGAGGARLVPLLLRTGTRRGLYLFVWDSGPWLATDLFLAASM
jgi:hypothetical protein